jgi:Bifunctional DNA primase/polymerase, N-terminal
MILRYAEIGIRVGPAHSVNARGECTCQLGRECPSAGKHPSFKNWQQLASNDVDDLVDEWAGYGRCNVFGAAGQIFDALDIDMPDLDVWMVKTGFALPRTWHQRTGTGNHQLMFQAAPGVGSRVKVPSLPATDTRGLGGLVILPPSRNAKGEYAWIVAPWECELAPWPPEVLAAVKPPPRPAPSLAPRPEGLQRAIPGWLHRIADEGATEGQRNTKAFWVACRCRALGLDEGDALRVLWRFGQNCNPRMEQREIDRTWVSSARHQGYEPPRRLTQATRRPSVILTAPERRPSVVVGRVTP